MVERLELLLKKKNLSPAQLADEIGVQRSGIYHIMKGRNKPGMDFLQKLLNHFPDINPGWLILGKGNMMGAPSISLAEEPAINAPTNQLSDPVHSASIGKHTEKSGGYQKPNKAEKKNSPPKIDKIVVFYSDQTFTEYHPNEKPV